METTNALKIRQNLGAVLAKLARTGKHICVERNRKPVAVLISWDEYQRRFVDQEADEARKEIVQKILSAKLTLPNGTTTTELLRTSRAR